MSSLAYKLKIKIEEKQVSVYSLEKTAGLKPSAIHNILQGKSRNPTVHTLQAIARALNCPVHELIDNSTSQKGEDIWDAELYREAIDISIKLFKEQDLSLSQEQALNFINEIYHYSSKANKKHIDHTFARWLYDKIWHK